LRGEGWGEGLLPLRWAIRSARRRLRRIPFADHIENDQLGADRATLTDRAVDRDDGARNW